MLQLLIQLIDLYTVVILAAVILSWIRLSPGNPVSTLVHMLTEPVLAPGPPDYSAIWRVRHLADASPDRFTANSLGAYPEPLILHARLLRHLGPSGCTNRALEGHGQPFCK